MEMFDEKLSHLESPVPKFKIAVQQVEQRKKRHSDVNNSLEPVDLFGAREQERKLRRTSSTPIGSSSMLMRRRESAGGDRFIPSRAHFDVDMAHFNLTQEMSMGRGYLDTSPAKEEYKATIEESFFQGRTRARVLDVCSSSMSESLVPPSPLSVAENAVLSAAVASPGAFRRATTAATGLSADSSNNSFASPRGSVASTPSSSPLLGRRGAAAVATTEVSPAFRRREQRRPLPSPGGSPSTVSNENYWHLSPSTGGLPTSSFDGTAVASPNALNTPLAARGRARVPGPYHEDDPRFYGGIRGRGDQLRLLYTYTENEARQPQRTNYRAIRRTAVRTLDAPDLLEDYYLNLLDWSSTNVICVAFGGTVYLWNAASTEITKLTSLASDDDYVSSVSWMGDGSHVAIGCSDATVQLWDVNAGKKVRTLTGHSGRVASLSWNGPLLSTGSRDATINNYDVRVGGSASCVSHLIRHVQEVCGLRWSNDGRQLASGGNDNRLCIWDKHMISSKRRDTAAGGIARANRGTRPLHMLTRHCAAVKGLAWCPWEPRLLASGGGTADRTIRFWQTETGACLNAVDTKSQVCAIQWSQHYKELVSSHGFSQNQLIVWSYPTMAKICELTGHTARVLHLVSSPDGETVCSGSGDETLRFWRIFEKRAKSEEKNQARLMKNALTIR